MAILAIFTGKGLDKKKYDTLIKEVGWKQTHPSGAIVHVASFDDKENIHVADVWESKEALDAFVEKQLMPVMKRMSIPMPSVEIFAVHNIDSFKGIDRYKVQ